MPTPTPPAEPRPSPSSHDVRASEARAARSVDRARVVIVVEQGVAKPGRRVPTQFVGCRLCCERRCRCVRPRRCVSHRAICVGCSGQKPQESTRRSGEACDFACSSTTASANSNCSGACMRGSSGSRVTSPAIVRAPAAAAGLPRSSVVASPPATAPGLPPTPPDEERGVIVSRARWPRCRRPRHRWGATVRRSRSRPGTASRRPRDSRPTARAAWCRRTSGRRWCWHRRAR